MSCFSGKMAIYKNLSIDRFDGNNLNASAFFLSHCHTDHMVGLDSEHLIHGLKQKPATRLYVSEITEILLLSDPRYTILKKYVQVLPVEEPQLISFRVQSHTEEVTVTLLPAAHCPGSVMFLFEGSEGTALYTGDFRLPKGSGPRMKFLHSGSGMLKVIDHIHVDTTFCVPNAFYIPSREQCLEALRGLVGDWINKGAQHVVRINMGAKYGYEYLYEALYHLFKKKIYCSRKQHYKCLPELANILTDDPKNSQIYACYKTEKVKEKGTNRMLEGDDKVSVGLAGLKFLYITLSTLYFTHEAKPEDVKLQISDNHYRLCFSFHSSLAEVCDFLSYLRPKFIHANVIPSSGETFKSVEDRLKNLCFKTIATSASYGHDKLEIYVSYCTILL
ncbi:unnamed protein product [Clavelina lepadiformis]|uniref:Protein artemis n=1 Tax=Clavelina lepadiformis TaxID=159417 RepID=A0ABP0H6R7_CLALP